MAPTQRSREERVTFQWRHFLLLTCLVVTVSNAQLCHQTRYARGTCGKHRRHGSVSARQIRNPSKCRKKDRRNKKPPQTLTPLAVEGELEPSKRPPTGGWPMRVSDCPHSTEPRAFRENTVMRSPVEPDDGSGRHSSEKGTANGTASVSASPCSRCGRTMRLQQTTNKTETFFGCRRFPL